MYLSVSNTELKLLEYNSDEYWYNHLVAKRYIKVDTFINIKKMNILHCAKTKNCL
jgi:hypothetical protein